jgi:hypothetical protein
MTSIIANQQFVGNFAMPVASVFKLADAKHLNYLIYDLAVTGAHNNNAIGF